MRIIAADILFHGLRACSMYILYRGLITTRAKPLRRRNLGSRLATMCASFMQINMLENVRISAREKVPANYGDSLQYNVASSPNFGVWGSRSFNKSINESDLGMRHVEILIRERKNEKQGHHHIGDQANRRPPILCSICVQSFRDFFESCTIVQGTNSESENI